MRIFDRHLILRHASLSAALLFGLQEANADEPGASTSQASATWHLTLSPFTQHYHPKPEHSPVWLVGVERVGKDNRLMGVAYFNNSFGQDSVYIYPWGQTYPRLWGFEKLTGKWSAGLIYGYTGKYEDKVPFNHHGYSPGFVPALSWALGSGYEAQVSFPGGAGLMFNLQVPLFAGQRR